MLLLLTSVLAQVTTDGAIPDLNAQLFRPSIDSASMMWTDESLRAPDRYTMGRFALQYVNDPVVYLNDDGERTDLVSSLWQLSLLGAHTRGPLRLGVDLPVYLRSDSALGTESGIGDLALDLRYTVRDRRTSPTGLATVLRFTLPTTTVEAPLGSRSLGWEFALVADKQLGPNTLLAMNVGTRGLPELELENVNWGDQLILRAGLGHSLNDSTGLSLDLAGHFTYGEFDNPAGRPIEAMVGGWNRTEGNLTLRGGVGAGLNSGIGAPTFRMVFALAYEPDGERDTDLDGVMDSADDCPFSAEDPDSFEDEDGCPDPTPVRVLLTNRNGEEVEGSWRMAEYVGDTTGGPVRIEPGSYSLEARADGYAPQAIDIQIPAGGEFPLTMELVPVGGFLLVSVVDSAGEAVPEASWRAVGTVFTDMSIGEAHGIDPGAYSITVFATGYRPAKQKVSIVVAEESSLEFTLQTSKAHIKAERIEISESVHFETNEAVIKEESHGLLDDVAAILDAHPELAKVRIEGHTDGDGDHNANLTLSHQRAQAVADYFAAQGIDPERLVAVGYGEGKPVVPNNTPENKARNRRVEFHVAERGPITAAPTKGSAGKMTDGDTPGKKSE